MKPTIPDAQSDSRTFAAIEIVLIVLLFFVLGGTPPPDVNEAHYLAKARHYWDPQWCAGDHFLESADAHLVFYWSFGWLTRIASLETAAWIGRFLTWGLLAWSWQRLSIAVVPGKLYSVLSAALFAMLIRWGHMAGEWIIGGVEAKGFAYAFLLLALEALVRERWRRAIVLCGIATAFHVLVGGWALVAVAWTWLISPRDRRPPLGSLWVPFLAAVILSLPGLLPGLALTWRADPAIVREANQIYVFERLSHHLVFHDLPHIFIARHATLMAFFLASWIWLRRFPEIAFLSSPLPRFVLGSMLIAMVGAIIDQSLLYMQPLAAALLRYYWFRMSDVMTPLGVTFVLIALQQHSARNYPRVARWTLICMLVLVSVEVCRVALEHRQDPRPGAVAQAFPADQYSTEERLRRWRYWRQTCQWIAENTESTDIFLTPRNQQTFKWDASRAEVVTGKDVPQDAAGIVAWRQRMLDIFPPAIRYVDLVAHGEPRLRELAKTYGFRYIVIDRGVSTGKLNFPQVYPERNLPGVYEVYRVPLAN